MAFDRLALYNAALLLCGERFLASLTEEREPKRLLDQVWSTNGINAVLEQAQWHFAMRTARIEVDPAFPVPDFGYQNAFSKPDDWIRTSAVCSDEFYRVPLLEYADEMGYWFANIEPLYVKFVSNGAQYGSDLSLWPASFCDYAGAYFASRIISKLSGDKASQHQALFGQNGKGGILDRTLSLAKSKAAMTQPTQFPAQGSWTSSRRGGRPSDRGNRGQLIG